MWSAVTDGASRCVPQTTWSCTLVGIPLPLLHPRTRQSRRTSAEPPIQNHTHTENKKKPLGRLEKQSYREDNLVEPAGGDVRVVEDVSLGKKHILK